MKAQVADQLRTKADEIARHFSNPDRAHNGNNETFAVARIKVLSEHCAATVFLKSSGKLALAVLYYLPAKSRWEYFFPTDSHLLGLGQFAALKEQIEDHNFKKSAK